MIRTLLTTTALALLLSAPAMAQDAVKPVDANAATAAPADTLIKSYVVADNDNLATRLIGQPVYTSAAADAENIGDINDLVLNPDGRIGAAIIGVGGFLGVGEKNVAVDYANLKWTVAADNTERFVLGTTKDALLAAADFVWPEDRDTAAVATPNAMATDLENSTDTNASATPAANADVLDRNAMTPVEPGAMTADNLMGTKVVGPDNNEIAEVGDIVLTPEGQVDALLVDFGGFLGMGEKRVAVGLDNLQFLQDANGTRYVFLNVTADQLNAAAAYDADTYQGNRDAQRLVING